MQIQVLKGGRGISARSDSDSGIEAGDSNSCDGKIKQVIRIFMMIIIIMVFMMSIIIMIFMMSIIIMVKMMIMMTSTTNCGDEKVKARLTMFEA